VVSAALPRCSPPPPPLKHMRGMRACRERDAGAAAAAQASSKPLRGYQQQIVELLANGGNFMVVAPTGAGKVGVRCALPTADAPGCRCPCTCSLQPGNRCQPPCRPRSRRTTAPLCCSASPPQRSFTLRPRSAWQTSRPVSVGGLD
jgi:hypothetical protein